MIRILLMGAVTVLVIALALLTLSLRRRKNRGLGKEAGAGFRPDIGFSGLDGMTSLSLLLTNKANTDIWVEDIEIFLGELDASFQAARPSYYGVQPIRESLGPGDQSSISLSALVYKAGGECQRWYSFVLSSVVRYRIGDQWLERRLSDYRVEMIGFITASLRRERKTMRPIRTDPKGREQRLLDAKPSSG